MALSQFRVQFVLASTQFEAAGVTAAGKVQTKFAGSQSILKMLA